MKNLFLFIFFLPVLSFAKQQPDTSKSKIPSAIKDKLKSVLSNKQQESVKPIIKEVAITPQLPAIANNKLDDRHAYRTIPWLHMFLDTSSAATIYKFLNDYDDSTLQLVQYESLSALHAFFSDNPRSPNDRDGDGTASIAAGGSDCDDLDNRSYRGNPERCEGYFIFENWNKKFIIIDRYHDEDCEPCTVAGSKPDGDEDRDNQKCSSCINYFGGVPVGCDEVAIIPTLSAISLGNPARRYTVRGWDCNDLNPAIIRAAQICIDERTVAVCENGKWVNYPCRRCVTQPNGTGVLVEH